MSWKLAIFGISIMVMCCSGNNSKAAETKILSISRQTILDGLHKANEVHVLTTCFEFKDGIDPTTIARSNLIIGRNDGDVLHEKSFREYPDGIPAADTGCMHFFANPTIPAEYMSGRAYFRLEGKDVDNMLVDTATAEFTFPAVFLNPDAVENTLYVGKEQKSLRIKFNSETDRTGWNVCKDDDTNTEIVLQCDTTTHLICYAIEVGKGITSYSLCLQDSKSSTIFKTATIDEITAVDTPGTNPTEARLIYDPLGTPDKPGEASTMYINGITKTNEIEFVLYDAGTVLNTLHGICHGLETECLLVYTKSKTTMKLITTDIDLVASIATKSDTLEFEDYDVSSVDLGPDVIEMYWEKSDVAGDYYAASIAIVGGDANPLQRVVTDCSGEDPGPGPTYCFAYFVGTGEQGTKYFATIAPNTDGGDWDPKLTNQIKSEPIIPFPLKDSLVIHVETTATIITDRNTEVDVCFNHVANASTQGTQYEFLAVNSKGTWKKFLGEKKKDESHACFYALELLTADYNENSKFLVLLRDTTNGKVLASGEAELNLQALRAIKPEVDNGNNRSTSTMAIVGAAIAGIACLMALVAAAVMFVMKIKRDNDGLQYPLHRTNIEQDSSYIHGLDNPIPTM